MNQEPNYAPLANDFSQQSNNSYNLCLSKLTICDFINISNSSQSKLNLTLINEIKWNQCIINQRKRTSILIWRMNKKVSNNLNNIIKIVTEIFKFPPEPEQELQKTNNNPNC